MNAGYLYVLTNTVMPNVIYIGTTGILGAHEINHDERHDRDPRGQWPGFPGGFHVEFEIFSAETESHMAAVEIALIRSRVSRSRHFFRVPLTTAILCVTTIALGFPYETDSVE